MTLRGSGVNTIEAAGSSLIAPFRTRAYSLLFAFLFLPYAYFNHSDGWNQAARFAQLHAMVLEGSFNIDAYHQVTGDKALIDGHYYNEKAPAIGFLALPVFSLTVIAQAMLGVDPDAQPGWRVSEWITTGGSVAVLAAGGGLAFFALLCRQLGAMTALIATTAVFLGTLAFPYATTLFSHAGTIGLLMMALWAALERSSTSRRRDYFGGVCAGLAIASEYPAVIPCGVLGLYLAYDNFARACRFGVALVTGLALILINNYLSTGSPFVLAYGQNATFPKLMAENSYGFSWPSVKVALQLMWGEYRGLLFWNPVLWMALPGMVVLVRSNKAHALIIVAAGILTLLHAASFYGWHGGSAVGPRYLLPAIPLLGLAAAYGVWRFPKTGQVLTLVSVLLMGMVTAIALDPPEDVLRPLQEFYLVRIEQGRFATNLGMLLGLSPIASLGVLSAIMTALGGLLVWEARAAPAPLPASRDVRSLAPQSADLAKSHVNLQGFFSQRLE